MQNNEHALESCKKQNWQLAQMEWMYFLRAEKYASFRPAYDPTKRLSMLASIRNEKASTFMDSCKKLDSQKKRGGF